MTKERSTLRTLLTLAACLVLPQVAGVTGAFFTAPAIPVWYAHLEKPFFTPPDALFGPVWIFLYVLMGLAFFLLWAARPDPKAKKAATLFFIQLVLNGLWSPLFFGLRSPLLGLVDILLLDVALTLTVIAAFRVRRVAGVLLVPYAAWTYFATLLNLSIWWLNRG